MSCAHVLYYQDAGASGAEAGKLGAGNDDVEDEVQVRQKLGCEWGWGLGLGQGEGDVRVGMSKNCPCQPS